MKGGIKTFNMKNKIILIFALAVSVTLYTACDPSDGSLSEEVLNFENLIAEMNKTNLGNNHKAVSIAGNISVNHNVDKGKKQRSIHLRVTGRDGKYHKYDYSYELNDKKIDILEGSFSGQIIYLVDNLVVKNLESGSIYNFIISDFENRTGLKSIHSEGIGIGSTYFDSSQEMLVSEDCSCNCDKCDNCNGPFCGSLQASCQCGDNSHSIICRDCYNAVCTDCSHENEQ